MERSQDIIVIFNRLRFIYVNTRVMDFTSSNNEPSLGVYLIVGFVYTSINVLVLYSFLKLWVATLPLIFTGFVIAQTTSVSIVYIMKNKFKSFVAIVSAVWSLSTRTKSDSFDTLKTWIQQTRSNSSGQPQVMSISPNSTTGDVEIEVVSSEGFGFIYGDITDISASPDDAEFARKDTHGSKFKTCYFCRNTQSDYKTGVHYKSKSNCSHQHAICTTCIQQILNQMRPTLEKYTTTEELVANNI